MIVELTPIKLVQSESEYLITIKERNISQIFKYINTRFPLVIQQQMRNLDCSQLIHNHG